MDFPSTSVDISSGTLDELEPPIRKQMKISSNKKEALTSQGKADLAFEAMKSVLEKRQCKERDRFSAFGEVVGHKLRNLSTEAEQNIAEFKINEILFRASMGEYKQYSPSPATSTTVQSGHSYHLSELSTSSIPSPTSPLPPTAQRSESATSFYESFSTITNLP